MIYSGCFMMLLNFKHWDNGYITILGLIIPDVVHFDIMITLIQQLSGGRNSMLSQQLR